MDETQVVIVGAGPSGLALGLALAKFQIQSVILEKENGITTDPRGVYFTGDAIRILHDLGLGQKMHTIGHDVHQVNFHQSSFSEKPFFSLSLGNSNILKQTVSEGMLQSQPKLEEALRTEIGRSEWCTLRTGCTVVSRISAEPPMVEYVTENHETHRIQGQWLVGADGKMGIVRKHFLEPTAGIKQEEGAYRYNGTWIAANLKISVPTPETHPRFPLWELGYSPDDVYDLFWPQGWHFCSPPGKPTASGRFGPHCDRTWRHELRQDQWDDSMDAERIFWQHITPMITRSKDEKGRKFPGPAEYPRDCITILRCRPFRFTHKVVNKWFYKRTILIGDAAHVFPPFAGQGIASGVRDAHQLAWRLALLVRSNMKAAASDAILRMWALERRKSVDDAALLSVMNGMLCNNTPSLWLRALLRLYCLLETTTLLPSLPDPQAWKERQGFTNVNGGFILRGYNGGARLAQIYMHSSSEEVPVLSDQILQQSPTLLTLLIIGTDGDLKELYRSAKSAISAAQVDSHVLLEESIVAFNTHRSSCESTPTRINAHKDYGQVFYPPGGSMLTGKVGLGYDDQPYVRRLGRSTKFALVRPDFFVFACARNSEQLRFCLSMLKERLG